MTYATPTSRIALAVLASTIFAGAAAATTTATPREAGLHVVSASISATPRTSTYDWPLKPFGRQHPVRSNLNDPRIGAKNSAFHFGIDIAAPDGTAVYAVEGGKVYYDSPSAICVVAPDGSHSFGYWHVVPAVKSHQIVRRHQLIAWIRKGWEHVHFAERRAGEYVNPLRSGGIGPYDDSTTPTVSSVEYRNGAIVVDAHDTPSPAVPGAWNGEPVTAAMLRWRTAGTTRWNTIADFRSTMLPASRFHTIFTSDTLQNHKGVAGRYTFYLARGAQAARLASSDLPIEIEASDITGNRTVVAWLAE